MSLYKIVIIEDNEADAELCKIAFQEKTILNDVKIFDNVNDGLEYVQNSLSDVGLIFLDINLPEISGFDFLEKIKDINAIIPIVVLTSSSYEEDIIKSYNLGANAFITKPLNFQKFNPSSRRCCFFLV